MRLALLVYNMDGVYHHIPLAAKTLEKAETEALEYMYSEMSIMYDDERMFEIIEVGEKHRYNTEEFKEWFDKRLEKDRKHAREQQERLEREQFERLKKKFDK